MEQERKLQLWAGNKAPAAEYVPRPELGDVLYAAPNTDGSHKMCGNCFMWQTERETCMIHDPGIIIRENMICGYHVPGTPQPDGVVLNGVQFVDPETSGLEQVEGGTSCDTCKHYRRTSATQGSCRAVSDSDDPNADAIVEALGCCTRWRQVR